MIRQETAAGKASDKAKDFIAEAKEDVAEAAGKAKDFIQKGKADKEA